MTRRRNRERRIGQDKSLIDRRWPFRIYRRLFGSEDMHTHYRWAAVSPFIDRTARQTLEVGGGDGRIAFEAIRSGHTGQIWITEFDEMVLDEAKRTAELGEFDNVVITQRDLESLQMQTRFDQVLAIDVLEHILDDEHAIREIASVLTPGGRLVVSVPTPLYPRIFGRTFHERIGHVRDGYWLEDLTPKLRSAGFSIDSHRYYTGPAVARACRVFYRSGIPYWIGVLWAPLVRPLLMRADRSVEDRRGASLALAATLTP